MQAVLTRGGIHGNVSFGFSGGWYAPSEKLNDTLKPLIDAMPYPPRAMNFDVGDYLHSAENLAGGSLNTTAPGGRDTFYAKSLITPEREPMSRKAIRAFVATLATEGFSSELVSNYRHNNIAFNLDANGLHRGGGSCRWTFSGVATPSSTSHLLSTRPSPIERDCLRCSCMDQPGTISPHIRHQDSHSWTVRYLRFAAKKDADLNGLLDSVDSILRNSPRHWGAGCVKSHECPCTHRLTYSAAIKGIRKLHG